MIANFRYLQASLFSFCIHAAIFLYLYGTFDSDTTKKVLISKPLQVQLKFDIPNQKIKNQIQHASKTTIDQSSNAPKNLIYAKANKDNMAFSESLFVQSNISNLLSEEKDKDIDLEQQEISMYAQKIISTIENAWMKPRNIPQGLIANLRLKIRSSGRIVRVDLIKSSGNIRFDNSALQAVRRVETFNFFDSISKSLYESEFQIISISFNPS